MLTRWCWLALLCLAAEASDFTWCYSCVDIDADQSWCRKANDLLKKQMVWQGLEVMERLLHSMYGVQRCGEWYPFCVIQEVVNSEDGDKSRYVRGCSDGQDFSFTYLDGTRFILNVTDTRLTHVLPNGTAGAPVNRTDCLWSADGDSQVCVTVCQGDFCNGPQPAEDEDEGDTNGSDVTTRRHRELFWAASVLSMTLFLLTSRGLDGL